MIFRPYAAEDQERALRAIETHERAETVLTNFLLDATSANPVASWAQWADRLDSLMCQLRVRETRLGVLFAEVRDLLRAQDPQTDQIWRSGLTLHQAVVGAFYR